MRLRMNVISLGDIVNECNVLKMKETQIGGKSFYI